MVKRDQEINKSKNFHGYNGGKFKENMIFDPRPLKFHQYLLSKGITTPEDPIKTIKTLLNIIFKK